MTALQQEIVSDLLYIENDLAATQSFAPCGCCCEPSGSNTLTFVFNGTSTPVPAIISIASFKRQLDTGGYKKVQLLSATLRVLNYNGSVQLPILPQAQQLVTCSVDGLVYRVEEVKVDPTGSKVRLIAEGPAKGI